MIVEALFVAAVGAAAVSDLRWRRIPNGLNVGILVGGLTWRIVGGGAYDLGMGAVGVAVGLGLLIIPFEQRWVGGGDVKLLAAIGAWLGVELTLWAGLVGIALGGVIALAILATGGRALRSDVADNLKLAALSMSAPEAPRRADREHVPLGFPLAAAAAAVVFYTGGLQL